jgi:pyruvate dehydrogenase E1 component beta subunit
VTLRLLNGGSVGFGAQHSQAVENWFINVPGLKIVAPGTPADAYWTLRAAIDDDDPVLYFEHKGLLNASGPFGDAPPAAADLGRAEVVRRGDAVTLVAIQLMRRRSLEAAELLAAEGIEVEVIDPRTLAPLDLDTIAASVERTSRLVVVQESPASGSWGASLIAAVVEQRLESLDAPPLLIGCPPVPVPYASSLEAAYLPSVERIAEGVRGIVAY